MDRSRVCGTADCSLSNAYHFDPALLASSPLGSITGLITLLWPRMPSPPTSRRDWAHWAKYAVGSKRHPWCPYRVGRYCSSMSQSSRPQPKQQQQSACPCLHRSSCSAWDQILFIVFWSPHNSQPEYYAPRTDSDPHTRADHLQGRTKPCHKGNGSDNNVDPEDSILGKDNDGGDSNGGDDSGGRASRSLGPTKTRIIGTGTDPYPE